ncbi:MAG: hypothetical protein M3014_05220 [Chloroflexota bacterium]|nr:hypothetical protein [Chloroflexota bacterium]
MRRIGPVRWNDMGAQSRRDSRSRIRHLRPQMRQAMRLLRAASRLGVPGSIPAPPELLPMGARVLAQGYLNRFSMPMLNDWLLPGWMRAQSNPASSTFIPRSVINLMVNQTARNWTALGLPGYDHPVESLVDPSGMLTPTPGGPSLDWWVDIDGVEGRLAATQSTVLQRMQGGLPVVVTAYEALGLRVTSESWVLGASDKDWAATQIVLFNIADMPLKGTFYIALRPYNPEGIAPIYRIDYTGVGLCADGSFDIVTWPEPDGWALSSLRSGDLFNNVEGRQERSLYDPNGFAHGVLKYSFNIEPWEEAEFLAFVPIHTRRSHYEHMPLFTLPAMQVEHPDPAFYSRAKAATTIEWRNILDSGMSVSLPHRDLQASWEVNRAHLLALHDGIEITPGPDLYHSFWLRDAAYMIHALSACGYRQAAAQLLTGVIARQRRDGAFVSHHGEWDGTGQTLWAISRHLALHPDEDLKSAWQPALQRGAAWLGRVLRRSSDGLMPPGLSSEHLGPPDRYYWDDLWSLAGLEATADLLGSGAEGRTASRVASRLRRTLELSWKQDALRLGGHCIPAAPGRGIDLGTIGSLVAWFPLLLLSPDDPRLASTLEALKAATFYRDALFVNTGHSGWGTYLNMRLAGCYMMQGMDEGWRLMQRLLEWSSDTYNWPEAIHPISQGGSAGDGHHGWASAEWLLLVRAMLLRESGKRLLITPFLPGEWLQQAGEVSVEGAPTAFGPLSYTMRWDDGAESVRLRLEGKWRETPGEIIWRLPDRYRATEGKSISMPVAGGLRIDPIGGEVTATRSPRA